MATSDTGGPGNNGDIDNVITFPSPQELTTPEMALRETLERGLASVLILGETEEGTLFVRSSGDVSRRDALWLLEMARIHAITEVVG